MGTQSASHRTFEPPSAVETKGATDALDRLWVEMQAELRRLAHHRLRGERPGHTLGTTGLIHEVYLKLAAQRSVPWSEANRGHFLALASKEMRRILIDYARRHRHMSRRLQYDSIEASTRHSHDGSRPTAVRLPGAQRADELLALDEALERLAVVAPRLAQVVECRFYAGYTEEETAEALGMTARTVTRDWVKARAWLHRELSDVRGAAS